jgi:thiamine-phosphate pyrophosphorylase
MPSPDPAALRAFDAALNRAREGLRVVEDYVRFGCDDAHLTRIAKELRHALAAAVEELNPADLAACRETQQDVGVAITTSAEGERASLTAVGIANLKRVQEALRSLEEVGKTISPTLGAAMEALRYRSYTLEKAVLTLDASLHRLEQTRLYVLIDGAASPAEFAERVKTLASAGADVLQLRDKTLDDRTLLARATELVRLTRGTRFTHSPPTLAIINDRADIAAAANADGVHVGQDELPVHAVRKIVGPGKLVGVSTHSIAQAQTAVLDGADYLGAGPVFPSPTKAFDADVGTSYLREVAAEVRLPTFAIGGITPANLPQVLAAGATRVAVSSAVASAADPAAIVKQLKAVLATSLAPRP